MERKKGCRSSFTSLTGSNGARANHGRRTNHGGFTDFSLEEIEKFSEDFDKHDRSLTPGESRLMLTLERFFVRNLPSWFSA